LLQNILKFIQDYSNDVGSKIIETILPFILIKFKNIGNITENNKDLHLLIVKSLLVFYTILISKSTTAITTTNNHNNQEKIDIFENKKNNYLNLILTPICFKMLENNTNTEFLQICGKSFIHIAKLSPLNFRSQVILLIEKHRTLLQLVMQQAQNQIINNSNSTNNTTNNNNNNNSLLNGNSATTSSKNEEATRLNNVMKLNIEKYKNNASSNIKKIDK
jgi:hypothetical protein